MTHGRIEAKFKCNFPECGFRGTSRKDYLWKHIIEKHEVEDEGLSANKSLRRHYEEAIRGVKPATSENKFVFELLEAASSGDNGKIRKLLSQNSPISDAETRSQGRTLLHLAARGGHATLARMLLENGADMKQKSSSGETALFMAIKAGHTTVVEVLLEKGASVHEISNRSSGISPLSMAVRYKHIEIVKLLIDHGSIPENITPYSNALLSAIESKQEDVVILLLKNGTDVNRRPRRTRKFSWFRTALHAAAKVGPSMTKLIIEAHGDLEARNGSGLTPLLYSLVPSGEINNEVVRLLVEAGAKISPESWERFTPELRDQFMDRCPIRPLDPIFQSLKNMLDIDQELDNTEEWNIDESMDFVAFLQDSTQYSSSPLHLGISEDDIDFGPNQEEQIDKHFE